MNTRTNLKGGTKMEGTQRETREERVARRIAEERATIERLNEQAEQLWREGDWKGAHAAKVDAELASLRIETLKEVR